MTCESCSIVESAWKTDLARIHDLKLALKDSYERGDKLAKAFMNYLITKRAFEDSCDPDRYIAGRELAEYNEWRKGGT